MCFKCVGDVATRGASDARVEYESSIFTSVGGHAVQSYSSANHSQNDLISVVDLRSYNG